MTDSVLDVVGDYARAAIEADSVARLQNITHRTAERLGFTGVNLFRVGNHHQHIDPHLMFGDVGPDFMAAYRSRRHVDHDMVASRCFWATGPFTWSEVEPEDTSAGARRLIADMHQHFARDALVCPENGGHGDVLAVVFTMVEGQSIGVALRRIAHTVAALYANVGVSFFEKSEPADRSMNLTRRELECVYWVSMGKSDNEISELLSISRHTAHHQIESAKAKLNVSSRVLLVRRAAALGLIRTPRMLDVYEK